MAHVLLFWICITLHMLSRRQWHPTPVLLPGKSHGGRSLVGWRPWGRDKSGTTERLHFHFSVSCTGERNGNPLQCSCLENPRDGGAWWAAVYGFAQSRTWLKQLSSSNTCSWLFTYISCVSLVPFCRWLAWSSDKNEKHSTYFPSLLLNILSHLLCYKTIGTTKENYWGQRFWWRKLSESEDLEKQNRDSDSKCKVLCMSYVYQLHFTSLW